MKEDAKSILARHGELMSARIPWESGWQTAANLAIPRKNNITTQERGPGTNSGNRLFDTTAIESVNVLANGHSSEITPAGTRWFVWEAPEDIKSDEADAWYNEASEKAAKILGATNLYTVLSEAYQDRVGFGISNIAAFPHAKNYISFQAHPVRTYCIDEDSEGNVDTVFLEKSYGIRQLEQMFGEEALLKNDKLAASWLDFKTKGKSTQHKMVHAVFPRLQAPTRARDILAMPYASVWVACAEKHVLQRSGYEELPYCASRYLKRSGAGQEYGYSPFEEVLAAILEANKMVEIRRVVNQRKAVPALLLPDGLKGLVDTRPGGKTVFNPQADKLPQEWLNKGDINGLLLDLQDTREIIQRAFHYDLFKMFAQLDKVMTAREVAERASEKLVQFSPSFTRFMADFGVLMERIFNILWRAGVFGKPEELPAAVLRRNQAGKVELPTPRVVYQSRLALAIRQAETAAADRLVERVATVYQIAPDVLDNIDLDAYVRTVGRNDGVPEAILRPKAQVDAMREDRRKAQEAQAKQQQMLEAATVAKEMGVTA
jgi:hypothetical protein